MKKLALLVAVVAFTAFALTACGDDDDSASVERGCSTGVPSSSGWNDELTVADDGTVEIEPLNEFLAEADGPVSTSPCDAARTFVRVGELQIEEGADYQVQAIPGDSAEAEATVTITGLPDDSILAERWRFSFEPAEGDRIEVVAARRDQTCRPGRGHQGFSPKPCL